MPLDVATKNSMLTALPSPVYLDLHSGLPTTGNSVAQARKAVTLPAASAGARTATGSPVCTFDCNAGTAAFLGIWDSISGGTRLGYYDNPDITLSQGDKVDLNSFSIPLSDVAGQ